MPITKMGGGALVIAGEAGQFTCLRQRHVPGSAAIALRRLAVWRDRHLAIAVKALAFGLRGTVMHTTDNGLSWEAYKLLQQPP